MKKPNALQLLITELCNFAIDVAAVTETWLNSNVSSCELTISSYKLFRRDREGRKGGGLCIFVKDSITADSIIIPTANSESKSDHNMHENLYLKLVKNNQVYLFLLVYHPPRAKYNSSTRLGRLANDVEHLTHLYPNAIVYLTGDFNQINTSVFLSDTGMHQTVTEPIPEVKIHLICLSLTDLMRLTFPLFKPACALITVLSWLIVLRLNLPPYRTKLPS